MKTKFLMLPFMALLLLSYEAKAQLSDVNAQEELMLTKVEVQVDTRKNKTAYHGVKKQLPTTNSKNGNTAQNNVLPLKDSHKKNAIRSERMQFMGKHTQLKSYTFKNN